MIDYEKRAMIEAEDKYTFRQSSQISSQTGLIGYLRADMDTDGNGFFSSWNDYRKDLKTDEFKQEFDEVINSLREEGDILHNPEGPRLLLLYESAEQNAHRAGLLRCPCRYRQIHLSAAPEPE